MAGFTGYQGKALYWRTTSAEYGRLTDYPLTLTPGEYQLTYAMAAWKGSPQYKACIINKATGSTIKSTTTLTASPNANGNGNANLSTAKELTLDFNVETAGNYVVKFMEVGSGMQEFLLLECKLDKATTGISTVNAANRRPRGIYSPSGVQRQALQHGLNIIVETDGNTRKVFIR